LRAFERKRGGVGGRKTVGVTVKRSLQVHDRQRVLFSVFRVALANAAETVLEVIKNGRYL
jgi:hypothetical protein